MHEPGINSRKPGEIERNRKQQETLTIPLHMYRRCLVFHSRAGFIFDVFSFFSIRTHTCRHMHLHRLCIDPTDSLQHNRSVHISSLSLQRSAFLALLPETTNSLHVILSLTRKNANARTSGRRTGIACARRGRKMKAHYS